jgi:uncharacterized damage-inducible protein DinB
MGRSASSPPIELQSERARRFLAAFKRHRRVNREFYERLRPGQLDYRMVETSMQRSDSPRESLVHQLYVTRNYAYSAKHGVMLWGAEREALLYIPAWQSFDKQRLLSEMERIEGELVEVLCEPDIDTRRVRVPWSSEPMLALDMLRGLIDHEVLHTGWNLALMDHLGMDRYLALRDAWG